jgi:hypothetical protein
MTAFKTHRHSNGRNINMFRRHFNATTVVAIVALVFAMTGGAYAAGKYLITSTKQISPKVLKSLKGKTGKAGPAGPAGKEGVAGKEGPAGKEGKAGANGTNGTNGANGANGTSVTSKQLTTSEATCGKQGGSEFTAAEGKKTTACDGTTGFTKTLPKGEMETGTWSYTAGAEAEGQVPISFSIPLAEPLTESQVHFILPGGEEYFKTGSETTRPSTACHGTPAEPEVAEGNLCIYASLLFDVELTGGQTGHIAKPSSGINVTGGADPVGALMFLTVGSAPRYAFGTWAVRAE